MSDKLLRYAPPEAKLPADLEGDRLIRPGHLATLCGVSRGTVYRMVKAGRIPKPRRLSHRVSGWRASEILPFVRGEQGASELRAG